MVERIDSLLPSSRQISLLETPHSKRSIVFTFLTILKERRFYSTFLIRKRNNENIDTHAYIISFLCTYDDGNECTDKKRLNT